MNDKNRLPIINIIRWLFTTRYAIQLYINILLRRIVVLSDSCLTQLLEDDVL